MKKALSFLNDHVEEYLIVLLLALMSIIIFVQVIARYVLKSSLPWSEELARYLFVWLAYAAISYGVKLNAHIRVDVVVTLLPEKLGKLIRVLADLLFLALAIVLLFYGWKVTSFILHSSQDTPALGIPMGVVYLAVPTGFALTAIRLIQSMARRIKDFAAEREDSQ